jgi:cobalt-zinc-cadmium efflux system membrane fusion protein
MKYLIALAALVSACSGCSRTNAAVTTDRTGPAPTASGVVVVAADSPMLKEIKREAVSEADLPNDEVVAPGKIELNPNRVAKVVLPVTGRVTSVLVKTGDAVKIDQPLLTVQSPEADAALSAFLSSQAAVAQAQAVLVKAQADLDRASDLFEHNAIAKKEVLSAESALAQGQAAVEQARAAREQAQRRLTGLRIKPGDDTQEVMLRAPLAGRVLELSVVAGEFRNDTSASLMTIADLSTVWVTSQVPETYIRFVRLGERVEISLVAYPGETFVGRVSRIADTLDPLTRTVKVQAELDNRSGRFRPEMYGSIHHLESTTKTLVIPATAIIHEGGRTTIFVERTPGHFEEREVSVGKRSGNLVRVSSGVRAGDSIVVDGAMLLRSMVKRT